MSLPTKTYQYVVAGLGAAGSATLYHLASRGVSVLGLEAQPTITHDKGSFHGDSRIIRLVYQEDPSYVALLQRAYVLWRELEATTGKSLLLTTGCINASIPGPEAMGSGYGHSCFDGAVKSAKENGLEHEILTATDVGSRFPAYSLPPEFMTLFDPAGALIQSEKAVQAHVDAAKAAGADVLCNTPVTGVSENISGNNVDSGGTNGDLNNKNNNNQGGKDNSKGKIAVHTPHGVIYTDTLVITTGAVIPTVLPELSPLLTLERQVVGWFRPTAHPETFLPENFPVYLMDDDVGYYYGFPADEHGLVKLGKYHHLGEIVDNVSSLDRKVNTADEAAMRSFLQKYFPNVGYGPMERASVCLFTNTTDGHFILDKHPTRQGVVVGSACSGHGFKFSPVIGEILADLVTEGGTRHNIAMHRFNSARPGHADVLKATENPS